MKDVYSENSDSMAEDAPCVSRRGALMLLAGATAAVAAGTPAIEALAEEGIDDDPGAGRLSGEYIDDGFYGDGANSGISLMSLDDEASDYTHDSKFDGYTVQNGIDVSKWNGEIDWDSAAADGVEFVFVRIGYRGYGSAGTLNADDMADVNLAGAIAAGIPVGAYIFSQAITTAEAEAEAEYIVDAVSGYDISLPLAMDFEYYSDGSGNSGRLYDADLSSSTKTDICLAFCERVEDLGYTPMLYANKSMLEELDASTISSSYQIWLAHYTNATTYSGDYDYWQYSEAGSVDGISGNVDLNFRYIKPTTVADTVVTVNTVNTTMSATSSISITWKSDEDVTGYELSYSTDAGSSWTTVDMGDATSYVLDSLSTGIAVAARVRAYQESDDGTITYSEWTDADWQRYTGKTSGQGSSVSAANKTIKVTWNAFSASEGTVKYRVIYRAYSGSSWGGWNTEYVTANSITLSSLSSNTAYQVKVYPVVVIDEVMYLGVAGTSYRFIAKTTPSATSSAISTIALSFSSVTDASGYDVYYRVGTDSSWTTVDAGSSGSYTLSSLSSGKAVAIQARPYKTISGVKYTGQWNDADWYRYTGKTSGLGSTMSASKKALTVSWNAFSVSEGTVKYRVIYRAYSGSSWGSWKTVNTTSTSTTLSSLTSNRAYQVKVYPVVTIDGDAYLGVCQVTYRFVATTGISASWSSSSSLKLTLTAATSATGYEVHYSTSSSFSTYTSKKSTSKSLTLSGLSKSKTYYVRARPYKVVGSTTYTGQWTSTKKIS